MAGPQFQLLLSQLAPNTHFTGDIKPQGEAANHQVDRPCDAVGVGLLAIRGAKIGAFIDPLRLVPRYLKASAAEEKAANP